MCKIEIEITIAISIGKITAFTINSNDKYDYNSIGSWQSKYKSKQNIKDQL